MADDATRSLGAGEGRPARQPAQGRSIQGSVLLLPATRPRGRAAAEAFAKGQLARVRSAAAPRRPPERPNIFKLYEENIGPLTPLIADALKDAEETYPPEWVAEAHRDRRQEQQAQLEVRAKRS